jgi:single-stranded-DNA-specific exonuclease
LRRYCAARTAQRAVPTNNRFKLRLPLTASSFPFSFVSIRVYSWLNKMKFRWSIAPPQPLLAGQLAGALKISPLLAQCLLNRSLSEADRIGAFLEPRLKQLADPFLLPHMDAAVDRLFQAHERREPLVIFGDYDVDGVTSTALLTEVLGALGWTLNHYLPHRMDEGYGLSQDGVENCLKKFPVTLLLAVDCGSTAVDSIAWLKQRGVDVIVLDHHQISNPAPAAVALVNPQTTQPSTLNPQPFRELCSVGLAFKLAHALVKRGREMGLGEFADFDLRPLLDLVALGTIADIVPLTGENRILVSAGLERLNQTQRPGLVALKKVAQVASPVGTYEVGFQLAPRLNAAGRLETAEDALHLLLARDLAAALPIAQNLDSRNRERQKIEKSIVDEVIGAVRARFDPARDFVIVEGQLLWHIGVVGIVASRVLQEFYRPTIIVGGDGADWRGSGRSIAGFDLAAALRECSDLLLRHGGHAMAAGLSISSANLDCFRTRLNELARRALKSDDLQPPLRLDADVRLDELTLERLGELERLRPMGQGNPTVQFCARNLAHQRPLQRIGADKRHVKMWVTGGAMAREAVWWGAGSGSLPVGRFDLAFAPQVNQFNGQRLVQLKVLDWRPASGDLI